MTRALVISGGGSKGAFAVGVLERLREAGVEFDMVSGTSTGALIAPLVATDEIPMARAIYSSVRTEDILRKRSIAEILFKDSVYDTHPLWSLINSVMTEERFQRIVASKVQIFMATVNLQTGALEYRDKHGVGPAGGEGGRELFMRSILASASQPVLMPPVRIGEGSDQYVDGGVREFAPLKVAIDHGAEEIYAIVLSPRVRPPKTDEYVFLVKTFVRTLDLLLEEVAVNDVALAELYNRATRFHRGLRARLRARGLSEIDVDALFQDDENPNPFQGKRAVRLQVIRPEAELPSDGLEFRPFEMAQMMEMGRQAAERALSSSPSVA